MTLKEIKDYFKNSFEWTNSISIGKIDKSKEKALCFYSSKREVIYESVMGGKKNKSTTIKPVTILLRYTKNQDEAEKMAQMIFEFFEEKRFQINNKEIFTQMYHQEPINLGTDDKNVYEYSIELNLYIGR